MKTPARITVLVLAVTITVVVPLVLLLVSINSVGPPGRSASGSGTPTTTAVTSSGDSAIAALLPNPGFEDGLSGWTAGFTGLNTVEPNQGYAVDIDRSVAYSGTASAYIRPTNPNTNYKNQLKSFGYLSTKISADIFRGKRVVYSAYLRTKDEGGEGAGLYMDVLGTIDGKPTDPDLPLSWDDMIPQRAVRDTTDWQRYQIVLDVPRQADFILVGLKVGAFGQTWVDNVQLETVNSQVPTTDQAGSKQLDNLDFEQGLNPWVGSTPDDGQTAIGTGTEMAHTGKLGAYIIHSGGGSNYFGSLEYPYLYGGYYQNKKVRVSSYLDVDKAPSGASFIASVDYLNADGRLMPPINASAEVMPSKVGWQKIEVTLDVPNRARYLTFGVKLDGDGQVWIDDVQVEAIGSNLTPTSQP